MVKLVSSAAEYDTLVASCPVVLVDFFAEWCGPCRAVAPILEKLSEEYGPTEAPVEGQLAPTPKVLFLKVDVDQSQELAVRMEVQAMPTFHIYKDGTLVKTIVGANVPLIKDTLASLAPKEEPAEPVLATA